MRRAILAWVTVSVALHLAGQQQPHTRSPLEDLLKPHGHAPARPANPAQTPEVQFDATLLGSPIVLDKGWRVGITANQSAAGPDFDDSTWVIRDATGSIADVPDEDHPADAGPRGGEMQGPGNGPPLGRRRPFAWFRLHVKLAPGHGPIALLVELPVLEAASLNISAAGPSLDIFANGKPIQPEGPHSDDTMRYQQISRLYNLNIPSSETSLVLVARTLYIPFGLPAYTNLFANRKLRLGNRGDLDNELELWQTHSLFERLPQLVDSVLLAMLALFLLALFFSQKGHPEYLWLALHEVMQAPIAFVDLAGISAQIEQLWFEAILLELGLVSAYFYFEFLISFLSLRKRWYTLLLRYTAPIPVLAGPILTLAGHGGFLTFLLILVAVGSFLWLVGWLLFVFLTLIASALRRNLEAGLLLIPLVLNIVAVVERLLTAGMSDFGLREYQSPLTIQAGFIPIHFASIAEFTGIFVIVLIIFVRFLRIQRNQERVTSELAAARSVQELMIPQEKLKTPGFEVDSIYNPANEVGGDFFHIEAAKDGGLLVVIGDVAGKGLKAAMNVSMLMGALRRTPERSPARILESLNRVLVGSDSFTTCQAAWFGANGELVLANAGHLPPYLNSQEVMLPGGLPLGVLADNKYEEVRLYLHPGDRILLLSDGVVEARTPSGELFGFDRVHNLSNQSAFYIADAAKAFGQEDDITVLTVRRAAQAMAA